MGRGGFGVGGPWCLFMYCKEKKNRRRRCSGSASGLAICLSLSGGSYSDFRFMGSGTLIQYHNVLDLDLVPDLQLDFDPGLFFSSLLFVCLLMLPVARRASCPAD